MKIYLSGVNVTIYERATTVIPAVVPSAATDYEIVGPVGQETIQVKDINTGAIYSDLFSNIENEAGATFPDLASVTSYLDAFIGSTSGGGGSTGSGVDTWVYKNSNYLPTARLTVPASSFSELVISNNVTTMLKTAATDAHDGTNFKFAEDDVVEVRVVMKIDGNTNSNLMRVKLRSRDGDYAIRQSHSDTNVQQFGQDISFNFSALHITAGTAAQGFDITISDFVSTADAFVYNIFFTIQKVGTKI